MAIPMNSRVLSPRASLELSSLRITACCTGALPLATRVSDSSFPTFPYTYANLDAGPLGCRNLLKYQYWRTTPPARDWLIEPDFDHHTADYQTIGGVPYHGRSYIGTPLGSSVSLDRFAAEQLFWLSALPLPPMRGGQGEDALFIAHTFLAYYYAMNSMYANIGWNGFVRFQGGHLPVRRKTASLRRLTRTNRTTQQVNSVRRSPHGITGACIPLVGRVCTAVGGVPSVRQHSRHGWGRWRHCWSSCSQSYETVHCF
eukprot:COSAG05_NODE_452_length_9699_cov_33.848125_8_plen_257_part_00